MDALMGLLDGPRARGAFMLRCRFEPPWSVLIRDEAPLSVVAAVRGDTWVVPPEPDPEQSPVRIRPGDVAVIRGPRPYLIADHPDTAPQVIIEPGQRCLAPDGRDISASMELGVRTWGTSATGSVSLLTGVYQLRGEVSQRLLAALPTVLLVPGSGETGPDGTAPTAGIVALLDHEIAQDEPGQEMVLDRLLDLLLISVLRAWFARDAPPWYRAQTDPVIGPALRALHQNPAHPWTVGSLATAAAVSRATFARRFAEVVGESPMAYLTGWRLALAADLLREPEATVAAVARQVGYGTAFALSAAFKRVHGVSPQQYRAAVPTAHIGVT